MTDQSPLATVDIEAIFAADPRTLAAQDHKALITELRRRRSIFASEEAAKQAKPKAAKTKAAPVPATTSAVLDKPNTELKFEDLFQ